MNSGSPSSRKSFALLRSRMAELVLGVRSRIKSWTHPLNQWLDSEFDQPERPEVPGVICVGLAIALSLGVLAFGHFFAGLWNLIRDSGRICLWPLNTTHFGRLGFVVEALLGLLVLRYACKLAGNSAKLLKEWWRLPD